MNSAPYQLGAQGNQTPIKECLTELHTPYSRTHDCMGRYGGMNYIDVPNIFRNFDADEEEFTLTLCLPKGSVIGLSIE